MQHLTAITLIHLSLSYYMLQPARRPPSGTLLCTQLRNVGVSTRRRAYTWQVPLVKPTEGLANLHAGALKAQLPSMLVIGQVGDGNPACWS